MKKWYKEEYKFKITVVEVGTDGQPEHCRNGHEGWEDYCNTELRANGFDIC